MAEETEEKTTRSLEENITSFQKRMIGTLRTELAVVKQQRPKVRGQEFQGLNQPTIYESPVKDRNHNNARWINTGRDKVPNLEAFDRGPTTIYNRVINRCIFLCKPVQGKEDTVPNYNPHPSPRAGIGQIRCLKIHVGLVVEGMRKKKIMRIPPKYIPLELSPRRKHLGRRRDMTLMAHQTEVLRNR